MSADEEVTTATGDAPGTEDARSHEPPHTEAPWPRCQVIAFGAGRGGTGKSLLAANVGIYLAQLGKKVVVLDADPAGGALHEYLGAIRPARGYADFLRHRAESLTELIVDTPIVGLGLVAGEAPPFGSLTPRQDAAAVSSAIRQIEADYVVVDLGPPDSALCIDVWVQADVSIAVTLPDPASIDATYRFIKSAFLRRLALAGLDRLVSQPGAVAPAPLDIYRGVISSQGPAEAIVEEMAQFRPRFIVSQTGALSDLKLGVWMASAARRRLGHALDYLGHTESDEAVLVALRRRRPLVSEYPESKVAKSIEKITRRLLSTEGERAPAPVLPRIEDEQTYYEILETEPGVSDEEIRRAFRRMKEIYASNSPAIAGLYDDHELAALHARMNLAHDTLFAPERRRAYDLSLPEADLARAVRVAASISVPRTADRVHDTSEPVLEPGTELTGAVLRKIREGKGMELSDVALRTKISERHLRNIEDERFDELPAPVYVRGFVIQYAQTLRLDPKAAEPYLRRFRAHRSERGEE